MQTNRCTRRKVIGESGSGIEEQRQVVLDAAWNHAVADVLIQRRLRRIAFEDFPEPAAKARACCFVLWKLPRRQKADIGHRIDAALSIDVEALDRFDRFVEEVDTVRERASHRKQIDQASAQAVFARRDHLGDPLVAAERELRLQSLEIELFALSEEE